MGEGIQMFDTKQLISSKTANDNKVIQCHWSDQHHASCIRMEAAPEYEEWTRDSLKQNNTQKKFVQYDNNSYLINKNSSLWNFNEKKKNKVKLKAF